MAIITEPEDILTHFLRTIIPDMTRSGLSERLSNSTIILSGDGVTKSFSLPSNLSCIKSVSVGGTEVTPFLDYNIDLRNSLILFSIAPPSGTDNISIDIQTGTNWIYADKPRDSLKRNSFPRLAVLNISENSVPQGMSEDDTYETMVFQIDVLSYKNMMCQGDTDYLEGAQVTQYLAREIKKQIKANWRKGIKAKLFNPVFIGINPIPFDENQGIYRHMIEIQFNAFNAGE